MNNSLQYLIYLCQVKNDLNRKRRRFYYYMNVQEPIWNKDFQRWERTFEAPKHISYEEAKRGYKLAQTQMKAMTSEMRQIRLVNGVKFIWTNHGAIGHIALSNGEGIDQRFFKNYYDYEVFEQIVFGSINK